MKQKTNILSFNRYTISTLVLLIFAAASTIVLLHHNKTDAAASIKPGIGAAVPSKFSTTGTPGWWQGATSKSDMALFQSSHECFTSVQYHTGSVDVDTELQKLSVSQAGTDGSNTPGATLPMTLQTSTGTQQYVLHQYTLTSGDSNDPVMRGLELGYLQLSDGYVKIEGHCNAPDQLSATIPALQSVKFDENK